MERHILIETLKHRPLELANLPKAQDDYELVRIAVEKNGSALQYASERLRDDCSIIIAAIKSSKSCSDIVPFISEAIFTNKEAVLKLVAVDSGILKYVCNKFKEDKDIALSAMKSTNTSWGFRFLSDSLKKDPDVLREYIYNVSDMENNAIDNPLCCIELPDVLIQDDEIIDEIVYYCSNCEQCIYNEPEGIWTNEAFIARAKEVSNYCLCYKKHNRSEWEFNDEEDI